MRILARQGTQRHSNRALVVGMDHDQLCILAHVSLCTQVDNREGRFSEVGLLSPRELPFHVDRCRFSALPKTFPIYTTTNGINGRDKVTQDISVFHFVLNSLREEK